MQLKSLSYYEPARNQTNEWSIEGVALKKLNLFVGLNASGKTRLVHVISSLSLVLRGKKKVGHAHWQAMFDLDNGEDSMTYELQIVDGKIISEFLAIGGQELLKRSSEQANIWSATTSRMVEISPPVDSVTMLIRRDSKDHPFFELLNDWAANTRGYKPAAASPEQIMVGQIETDQPLEILELSPELFSGMTEQEQQKALDDFNKIGYNIEKITHEKAKGLPIISKVLKFKEKGLKEPIVQHSISTGMLRAFMLVLVINHACKLVDKSGKTHTMIIDDFTDGMDHIRSKNLALLITEKSKKHNLQFILTTNSRVFMDGIDIKNWNILVREGGKVKSLNYENSREKFDEFKLTGLNNFALFSSDYLSE